VFVPADDRIAAFPPVRALGPADLSRCVALSIDRGWSPERPKWGLMLAACEVYGIDAPDGRGLAGVVVLTRYGSDLASIGMMLVAARYERRGLGRALMEHAVRAAGDDTTVTLFATSLGRPLYEKLGFAPVRDSASFIGRFRPGPRSGDGKKPGAPAGAAGAGGAGGVIRAGTPGDLPGILAADLAAFGADRGHILRPVAALADRISVLDADGAVAGYALGWRNDVASTVIGPLMAPDDAAARRLVADVAGHARTAVRLDLDPARPGLPAWAEARGMALGGRTVVMAHGVLPRRGTPARLYTPVSVALA
jgi:GNAT superfamily N-acetyltransferase